MDGMRLRTVDAFSQVPFAGNPAAVLVLDAPASDEWMAAVARETNVSDTAFVIREPSADAEYRIRWFTPAAEVELCGHATLASAHCLFEDGVDAPIRFASRSGVLIVDRLADGAVAMDLPGSRPDEIDARAEVAGVLGVAVEWTGLAQDDFFLVARLADERAIHGLRPDLGAIGGLRWPALIVTAAADPGRDYDFVSRVFAPKVGIPEDPVTGSSHATLAPYWSERLGRASLVGLQASQRPGRVGVEVRADRVTITGHAVTVLDGRLTAAAQPT
jgi:PhzF family phenazine biosynthesis protein